MKVLLITDSSRQHFSGVVNKINYLTQYMQAYGYEYKLLTTNDFYNIPITRGEIRLALTSRKTIRNIIEQYLPDYIHLFTEGSLGLLSKWVCDAENIRYTTSYTTQFDLYFKQRYQIPITITQRLLNYFHSRSSRIFVPTNSMRDKLSSIFKNRSIMVIGRGVDHSIFSCDHPERAINVEDPLCIYAGRLAKEKNLESFLKLKAIKRKVVIGDGSILSKLRHEYPEVEFTGFLSHQQIKQQFNRADVFVFPSLTDTFGQVMLEAMSCGLPVAAYPCTGPKDIIKQGETGYLSEDLEYAIHQCKHISRQACVNHSHQFNWETATRQFLAGLIAA